MGSEEELKGQALIDDNESIIREDPIIYLITQLNENCTCLTYNGKNNKHKNGGINEALRDLFPEYSDTQKKEEELMKILNGDMTGGTSHLMIPLDVGIVMINKIIATSKRILDWAKGEPVKQEDVTQDNDVNLMKDFSDKDITIAPPRKYIKIDTKIDKGGGYKIPFEVKLMTTSEGSDFTLNGEPKEDVEVFYDKDYNDLISKYIILEIKESEEVQKARNAVLPVIDVAPLIKEKKQKQVDEIDDEYRLGKLISDIKYDKNIPLAPKPIPVAVEGGYKKSESGKISYSILA